LVVEEISTFVQLAKTKTVAARMAIFDKCIGNCWCQPNAGNMP